MSKHAYTEKWYQAAHCILDADEIQRTEAKGLPYLIERLQFGNKPQMAEALVDVKLASLLPDRDPRGCFSKPMKDLNFVAMHALFGRKVSDGVKPGKLAVNGPVDHQRGYKSNLSGEIIRQRMQEQPDRFADPDREKNQITSYSQY